MSGKEFKILSVTLFFQILLGDESQCSRIHAVAEARRFRAIRKDMAEMRIAVLAPHLGALHEETPVFPLAGRAAQFIFTNALSARFEW